MVKENERLMILDLLEKGKVSSEEADKLLTAIRPSEPAIDAQPAMVVPETGGKPRRAHWICIRITDLSSGKRKFSMILPIFFIRLGILFSKRWADDSLDKSSLEAGKEFFRQPVSGNIVDVSDPEDDERVEISFL